MEKKKNNQKKSTGVRNLFIGLAVGVLATQAINIELDREKEQKNAWILLDECGKIRNIKDGIDVYIKHDDNSPTGVVYRTKLWDEQYRTSNIDYKEYQDMKGYESLEYNRVSFGNMIVEFEHVETEDGCKILLRHNVPTK